jgi:hypothetical protein
MNAITKRIYWDIISGRPPQMIEADGKVLILNWITKYSVSGYLVKNNSESYKQLKIQKTKNGKQYLMADRTVFNLKNLKPCEISNELLVNELAVHTSLKNSFKALQADGQDVGHSITNQDFYIENITKYLNENGGF